MAETVAVWLLVGYVQWSSGGAAALTSPHHATKESCEASKQAIESNARWSKLSCVPAQVVIAKTR